MWLHRVSLATNFSVVSRRVDVSVSRDEAEVWSLPTENLLGLPFTDAATSESWCWGLNIHCGCFASIWYPGKHKTSGHHGNADRSAYSEGRGRRRRGWLSVAAATHSWLRSYYGKSMLRIVVLQWSDGLICAARGLQARRRSDCREALTGFCPRSSE